MLRALMIGAISLFMLMGSILNAQAIGLGVHASGSGNTGLNTPGLVNAGSAEGEATADGVSRDTEINGHTDLNATSDESKRRLQRSKEERTKSELDSSADVSTSISIDKQ